MGKIIEIGEKVKLEIGEFTTDRGSKFVSLRRLYKSGQDGNFYPQKTKSGGYNMIYLSEEEWTYALTALQSFFGYAPMGEKEDVPF